VAKAADDEVEVQVAAGMEAMEAAVEVATTEAVTAVSRAALVVLAVVRVAVAWADWLAEVEGVG